MRGDFNPADLLALRRLYRERNIDLVIVKTRQCIRMAWAARGLVARRGPAILCRMGDSVMKRALGAKLTYRYMADGYVTPSESCRRELLHYGYYGEGRIRCIPNGVVVLPDDTDARHRIRAELGLTDHPVLITTSRLHRTKGHAVLLDALAALTKEMLQVQVVIVGDGTERPDLEARACRLGIADAVVFTGFRTDVADVLRAADVFVLPSLLEGLPNTALEAMASGLPVVASHVDGVPELVADGETGLLVPPGDADRLADAIGHFLGAPELARAMGQAGRERVRAHFSLEGMLEATETYCLALRDRRLR